MNIYKNPPQDLWGNLLKRPELKTEDLREKVKEIFNEIKHNGDESIRKLTFKFDKVLINKLLVSKSEFDNAEEKISEELKNAIFEAKKNIEKFHISQKEISQKIETTKGVLCWRESRAIENVGLYIPGGTAPLFSTVLMLAIPAKLAGCKEIILCSPPDKFGKIHPAILFAAKSCGIHKIFKIGGAQAIAALTFGTESIPKVDKIFGPGNQFVTAAKQFATESGVSIDLPAGPSEVLVIADETAIPQFCAADLLAQAEHGTDSQVIFLCTDKEVFEKTMDEIQIQLNKLPRKEIAEKSIKNSNFILLNDLETSLKFSNLYAPEHLILAIKNPENSFEKIQNAGSVFVGNFSCESAGDYASGTNHTLPTNGFARNYSGVSLDSFVKKITFQKISENGIKSLGKTIEIMAEAESLFAHKNAVSVRLNYLENQ